MQREYILMGEDGGQLRLPVNPFEWEDQAEHHTENFQTLEIGEVKAIGRRKLHKMTLESFFPAQEYAFCTYRDFPQPSVCVQTILRWKDANRPIRLIITGTDINRAYSIEKFSYGKKDGTEDVYYTLELEEYRYLNVPRSNNDAKIQKNKLRERPKKAGVKKKRTEKQEKKVLELTSEQKHQIRRELQEFRERGRNVRSMRRL